MAGRAIVIYAVYYQVALMRLFLFATGSLLFSGCLNAQCDSRSFPLIPLTNTTYPKVIIHDVKFDGKITLPESDMEQFVSKLKKQELYAEANWVGAMESEARNWWQDRGYFKADVDLEASIFSTDSFGEHVFLTFHVQEGGKYWLKEIRFRESGADQEWRGVPDSESDSTANHSALIFPPDQLRKAFPLHDGEILRVDKVRDGLDALRKLFGSYGYIDFVADPLTDLNNEEHKISLTIELYPGQKFRLGRVEAIGLSPDQENALENAIPTGEILSLDSKDTIVKTAQSLTPGWSPDVQFALRRDIPNWLLDAIIDFRPCPPVQVR